MDEISRNLTPFQVLIIGLGNVGFRYDVNSTNQILTHYKGLITAARVNNLEIEITGVDPALQRRLLFEERVGYASAYGSLEQLPSKKFDLVIFACPTTTLVQVFLKSQEILEFQKAIIEKPIAPTLEQYENLEKYRRRDIEIRVGFPRRTIPSTHYLRDVLQKESKEFMYRVKLQVGGNILNIGSHFLDLIYFLFGSYQIDDYWDTNNYLRLRASNPNLELEVEQNSHENNERSEFSVRGPLNFTYKSAGRRLEFFNPDLMNGWVYDTASEIQGMLGFEALDYVGWAAKGKVSSLPALDDNPIRKLLERMQ
jgi:predicted dehydrogenase